MPIMLAGHVHDSKAQIAVTSQVQPRMQRAAFGVFTGVGHTDCWYVARQFCSVDLDMQQMCNAD